MSSTTANRPSGRAKSCVVCRQFKLACDARKTAPNPCSRCVDKGLKCRFDPNFKRISTRRIAQEVANELHELRAAKYTDTTTSGSTPRSQLGVSGQSPTKAGTLRVPSVSPSSSFDPPNSHQSYSPWIDLSDDEVVLDQSLGNVTLSSHRILKLFYHFERYYYPHARFLPKVTSINQLTLKCPLLSWTILLTAAERYEGYTDLYNQMCGVHDLLVTEILHQSIQKLEVVHALLILCQWPVIKLRNAYDPSWNYVHLAISAATSLSCHHPLDPESPAAHFKGISDTTAANMDPRTQAMTWLYCYQIGARLSYFHGLPPPICSPQSARSLNRAKSLSVDVISVDERAQLSLLDTMCSAQIQLDNVDDPDTHYSMTETYEAQLEATRAKFSDSWSWSLDVQLQAVKLHILGSTFTLASRSNNQQATIYESAVRLRCLEVATSLISTMTAMSNQQIDNGQAWGGILTYYPKHYFTDLMAATSYLFYFLGAHQGATQSQQAQAMTSMTEAHKIFQSFPDHRDAVRACINIEVFVLAIRTAPQSNTTLAITNRLGASVTKSANFWAAQQRNRQVDGSSPPVSQWTMLDVAMSHRIPLAPEQKVASPPKGSSIATWSSDNIALGIWDTYAHDFGFLNDADSWLGNDAEFAALQDLGMSMDQPAQAAQSSIPVGTQDALNYGLI